MDGSFLIALSNIDLMSIVKSAELYLFLRVNELLPLASMSALAIIVFPTPGGP